MNRSTRLIRIALLAVATMALATAALAEPLAPGSAIPKTDIAMKGVDGEQVTLADVAGEKGTLVVFTCNACPWAKAWEKRIAAIGNAAPERGVGVIAINANDPSVVPEDGYEEMKARAAKLGLEFPYVVDATQEVARAFGATRTPEVFLFDADGALVYHGAVDDNARDEAAVEATWLADAVGDVVAGRAVAVPSTKALGCTIKWSPS